MKRSFRKSDGLSCLTLGFIMWFFLIFISLNLREDIAFFDAFFRYKLYAFFILPAVVVGVVYSAFSLGQGRNVLYQFAKFTAIGAANMAIDIGLLNLMILETGAHRGAYYAVFKALSFSVALLHSYTWNRFWTFEAGGGGQAGRQFILFAGVSGTALVINVISASIVVEFVGPSLKGFTPGVWANLGAVSALAITVFWNFLGYKFLVFKN